MKFYIRREIVEKIEEYLYDRDCGGGGKHITVSDEQYDELYKIEGSKMNPNTDRDDELAEKIKDIIIAKKVVDNLIPHLKSKSFMRKLFKVE